MNNDILIIIYRDNYRDMLEAMYDLSGYLSDLKNGMNVDKYRGTIDICGRIHVIFRCGKIYNMAGLRPNYYQTYNQEANAFLVQSALKYNGKGLDSLKDIADTIREKIRRNETDD